MFRKMPFILLLLISVIVIFGHHIPVYVQSFLYTISLSIKAVIISILPLIIFGLLYKVMTQLAQSASKLILLILAGVCCSNFLSTFVSHYVGMWIYHFDLSVIPPQSANALVPLWELHLPNFIPNNIAMFFGIISGFISAYFKPALSNTIADFFDKIINRVLQLIIYLIPLFVMGFIVKLSHEGVVVTIVKDYALIFAMIALAQFGYIFLIYLISSATFSRTFQNIKNMLPAAITGFSTMSSAAAMPLTIIGAQKNAGNDFAQSCIPATVNVHLIGDCFAIPILAYAILKSFECPEPMLLSYLLFSFYFVLAKFSVAAVPGGGIIVMLPVLETYLGFDSQMLSLITALYILFDPVITCANVLGNGGFALFMNKVKNGLIHPKSQATKILVE